MPPLSKAAAPAATPDHHAHGMALAATGVLVLSFDALLIRLADSAVFDVAFWRGWLTCLATLLLTFCLRRRQRWPNRTGHWVAGLVAGIIYGCNSWLFVFSVSHTSAANTVVILASSPLFSALFSWLFLKERVSRRTLIAILVSIGGVMLVFAGANRASGQWLGDLSALLLAALMGVTFTLLRRFPGLPRLPLVAVSGAVTGLISWPLAAPLSLSLASYGWLGLMGLVQIPLATLLIMTAPRYLPSAEVSLFMLIETVLGPVWVWLALGEPTSLYTLLGGMAILGAIATNTWITLTRRATAAA